MMSISAVCAIFRIRCENFKTRACEERTPVSPPLTGSVENTAQELRHPLTIFVQKNRRHSALREISHRTLEFVPPGYSRPGHHQQLWHQVRRQDTQARRLHRWEI